MDSSAVNAVANQLGDHLEDFYHDNETTTMGEYEVIQPVSNPRHGLTHSQSNLSIGFTAIPGAPKMALISFSKAISSVLADFIQDNDSAKVMESLKNFDCFLYHDLFVAKAVRLVLSDSEETQACIASLLTVLYDAKVITRPQVTRAFEKLIQIAESLHPGIADVEDRIFNFIVAAVEDRLVDQSYLLRLPEGLLMHLSETVRSHEPHLEKNMGILRTYKQRCHEFMPEFFNSGEAMTIREFFSEVDAELFEPTEERENTPAEDSVIPPLKHDTFRHEFVRRLVSHALGLTNQHREMVSTALSDLYATALSPDDVQTGILRLLATVHDISLDVPAASEMISMFIVRMVVDDILPPAFVSDFLRLNLGDSLGVATLRRAFRWMTYNARHHLLSERFKKVWIGTEGYRPEVEEFKRELRDIIFDYFNTADVQTAITLFNGLDMSPAQEVEAIRKIISFALERQKVAWGLAVGFLMTLCETKEIDSESILKGFDQVRERLSDLEIDCPSARADLESFFLPECKRLGLLPARWEI